MPVLDVRGLSKGSTRHHRGLRMETFAALSFTLGAGKSTLLRALYPRCLADAGQIFARRRRVRSRLTGPPTRTKRIRGAPGSAS